MYLNRKAINRRISGVRAAPRITSRMTEERLQELTQDDRPTREMSLDEILKALEGMEIEE